MSTSALDTCKYEYKSYNYDLVFLWLDSQNYTLFTRMEFIKDNYTGYNVWAVGVTEVEILAVAVVVVGGLDFDPIGEPDPCCSIRLATIL